LIVTYQQAGSKTYFYYTIISNLLCSSNDGIDYYSRI
jgi:hypothetical protein